MTCIAALVDKGIVYMGCDSMVGFGDERATLTSNQPKVFGVGEFLIGVAGTFRTSQTLRYLWEPPTHGSGISTDRYMVESVATSMRLTLKDAGWTNQENGNRELMDSMAIVGYRGRLYRITVNFAVIEAKNYVAIGTGVEVALGSLYSTKGKEPKERIKLALNAAAEHISSVRGPFTILTLGTAKTISKEEQK